jgi:enamine deaminase RidA (YjgF/YER057c/UK114 family)
LNSLQYTEKWGKIQREYLTVEDMAKSKEVSIVRNKYLQNAKPASTLVEISNTVHKDCDIEIEVMAIISNL